MANSKPTTETLCQGTSKANRSDLRELTVETAMRLVDETKFKECLKIEGPLLGLLRFIKECSKEWSAKEINIAVSGQSGVGKSSLINALRGLKNNETGAATVGIVEVLEAPKSYAYPQAPQIKLWDLPGIGTQRYRRSTDTCKDLQIPNFDIVVVVTASRFTENDVWLSDQCISENQEVLFVRSKIDQDLQTKKEDFPDSYNEKKSLQEMKHNMLENINQCKDVNKKPRVFLISSRPNMQTKFDFPDLQRAIADTLNNKRRTIINVLKRLVEHKIVEDKEENNQRFLFSKVSSAVCGLLPVPLLESVVPVKLIKNITSDCLQRGNLDADSLKKIAEHLKEISDFKLKVLAGCYSRAENLRETSEESWSWAMRHAKYVAPLVGSVASAVKETMVTKECIDWISRMVAEDQKTIVGLLLNKLERDIELWLL